VHYNSSKTSADEVVAELTHLPGVKAIAFQADLSGYEGVHQLHAAVVAEMGHPDILFNNSGVTNKVVGPHGDIQDISAEEFESTWRTNAGTSFLVSQNFCGNEGCN
jgi:3-oxoacyl-[acyl-carrier protein] reductase